MAGAGLLVAAHVPDAWGAKLLRQTARPGPGRFLDGVASGDPSPTSVVLWGRLTTEQQRSGARLVVATDPGLTRTVATVVVPTDRSVDGVLKVRVGGLRPDTIYHYAWQGARDVSPVGRTKTLPDPSSDRPLRLAFSSCQKWDEGFFNPHLDVADEDPLDLYLFLGDYTYEYARPAGMYRNDALAAVDLRSARDKLRLYRSDTALRELHRLHPTAHIWDDHEVADNYTDNDPRPSELQRTAGYKASFEWLPHLPAGRERYRVYRSFRLGRMAEVFMLDERQYRTGDGDGKPKTILGRAQLDWLKAGLRASTARWKLVANPDMIAPLGVGGRGVNPDQWDGYPADRQELLDVCAGGVRDVMFLTGDIHTYFTARLLRDGGTSGPSVATEYVGGSVSSSGLPALAGVSTAAIFAANPWISYANGTDHGYGRVDLDATRARVTYRSAPVDRPGLLSRTLAVYDQPLGANDYTTVSQDGGGVGDPTQLPIPRSAVQLRSAQASTAALRRRRRKLERLVAE